MLAWWVNPHYTLQDQVIPTIPPDHVFTGICLTVRILQVQQRYVLY